MNDTDITEVILDGSRFWFQKVLVPIMVCIGISGNTITVMVLTRKRMQSSTNIYLSALAIADIIYLFFVFLLSFKHYNNINDRKYELYWRFYGLSHWLCDAASSTSVWLTVSFTIERYIAVCHPMKRGIFCTENRAKTVTVIVYIFCILTTASTTFEYQLSMNDTVTCTECKIDPEKLNNLTTASISTNNSLLPSTSGVINNNDDTSSSSSPLRVFNDPNLTMALKNILSSCTKKHPHIIYVYPQIFNGTVDRNNTKVEHFPNMTVVHHYINTEPSNSNENGKPAAATLQLLDDVTINETNETNLDVAATAGGSAVTVRPCCTTKLWINVESTNLGKNVNYTKFMYWYSALAFGLFPLVLIATFNCFLVRAVYLSQQKRRAMTNSTKSNTSRRTTTCSYNDNRITIMLISVVMMFLICQTPTASFLIYFNFYPPMNKRESNVHKTLGNVFNFLITVNASCNFLLYSTMSKKFRTTFKKLFLERSAKSKRQATDTLLALSSTKSNNSQKFNPYHHGLIRKNTTATAAAANNNNNNNSNNSNNNYNNNYNSNNNTSNLIINDEFRTPRNLETLSLTSAPRRTKTLMIRQLGRAKSNDLVV